MLQLNKTQNEPKHHVQFVNYKSSSGDKYHSIDVSLAATNAQINLETEQYRAEVGVFKEKPSKNWAYPF